MEVPEPVPGAVVLSYRWRTRGANENCADFKQWLSDVGSSGYSMVEVAKYMNDSWSILDDVPIQIEV